MKKILSINLEHDDSEIHKEIHKKRMGKGKNIVSIAEINTSEGEINIKIKPKCSK